MAANESAPASPAIPVAWPEVWGERHPHRRRAMLGLGLALLAVAAAMALGSGGATGPLWSGVVFGLFGVTALAVFARAPFGHGSLQMINAVTLTRARVAPPDSWVHFARERRTGILLLVVFAVWGIVLAFATVAALMIGLRGRPQALVGMVVVGAFAGMFLYGAVRGTIAQYRLDSFGRRPVGLSLGPSGIALLRVGDPVHLPWEAIRSVEADVSAPRRGQEPSPLIRLRVDPRRVTDVGDRLASNTVTLVPATVRLHPSVLWTALRVFSGDPAQRAKLGTTFGQQLLDDWCDAARREPKPSAG